MENKEYGQGFIDGFNAALKSDYLKEKFQASNEASLKARIKELEAQVEQMRGACLSAYGLYQSMQNQYQMNLSSMINAYPYTTRIL